MINFSGLAFLLTGLMYKDRMKTKRQTTVKNPDGSKGSPVLDSFLADEPCLVHERTSDSSKDDSKDVAPREISVIVFCPPHLDIVKGDFLELSVLDAVGNLKKVIKGFAGSPNFHQDHLEIKLSEWSVDKYGV